MSFSKPCCKRLAEALDHGDEPMIAVHGEEEMLMLAVSDRDEIQSDGRVFSIRTHWPILFCPFCGSHVQTTTVLPKGLTAIDELRMISESDDSGK